MPGRIEIRPEVIRDLDEVVAYFAQRGRIGAEEVALAFYQTIDELSEMPGLGSLKFHRRRRLREIRSWRIGSLPKILVFYRKIPGGIEIIAVFHGARDIKSLLNRRLREP